MAPANFRRTGKWTVAEEDYSARLIQLFELGVLDNVENGTTLRSFLSSRLNCAPMRISKKYAGKAIGKHVFNRQEENVAVAAMQIPSTLDLEMAFLDACFKKEGFAITENGTVLNTSDELAEYSNATFHRYDPASLAAAAQMHYKPDGVPPGHRHPEGPRPALYPMVSHPEPQPNIADASAKALPAAAGTNRANNGAPGTTTTAGTSMSAIHPQPPAPALAQRDPKQPGPPPAQPTGKANWGEILLANFREAQRQAGGPQTMPPSRPLPIPKDFTWSDTNISPMNLLPMQQQIQAHQRIQEEIAAGKGNAKAPAVVLPAKTPWPDFYSVFDHSTNTTSSQPPSLMDPLGMTSLLPGASSLSDQELKKGPSTQQPGQPQLESAVPNPNDDKMLAYGNIASVVGSMASNIGYMSTPLYPGAFPYQAAGAMGPNQQQVMTQSSLRQHQTTTSASNGSTAISRQQVSSYSHPALRPIGSSFKATHSNDSGEGDSGSDAIPKATATAISSDSGSRTPPDERPVSTSSNSSDNCSEDNKKRSATSPLKSSSSSSSSSRAKKPKTAKGKPSSSATSKPSSSASSSKSGSKTASKAEKGHNVVSDGSENANSTTGSNSSSTGSNSSSTGSNSSDVDNSSENSDQNNDSSDNGSNDGDGRMEILEGKPAEATHGHNTRRASGQLQMQHNT
mmetsp:Transcript_2404/g.4461  ORF Transcript_2404/g.4461 Transcript_2404/m.4461 type:complete len:681 (+) Transcript_2404:70-2112(+)